MRQGMIQFGIYSEHDLTHPFYDAIGNRIEGCRLCGQARDLIEREKRECVRPIKAPPGEFVRLLEPFGYEVPMKIDRESVERLRDAINSLYPAVK